MESGISFRAPHVVARSRNGFARMTACLVIAVGDIEMPEYSEGLRVRMTPRWREMDSHLYGAFAVK